MKPVQAASLASALLLSAGATAIAQTQTRTVDLGESTSVSGNVQTTYHNYRADTYTYQATGGHWNVVTTTARVWHAYPVRPVWHSSWHVSPCC